MTEPTDAAFPSELYSGGQPVHHFRGFTKREIFAALALQGILANPRIWEFYVQAGYERIDMDRVVRTATTYADKQIAELNKEKS